MTTINRICSIKMELSTLEDLLESAYMNHKIYRNLKRRERYLEKELKELEDQEDIWEEEFGI